MVNEHVPAAVPVIVTGVDPFAAVPTEAVAMPLHPLTVKAPVYPASLTPTVVAFALPVPASDTDEGEATGAVGVCGVPVSATVYGPGTMYPPALEPEKENVRMQVVELDDVGAVKVMSPLPFAPAWR
jgi:hypothetical protein